MYLETINIFQAFIASNAPALYVAACAVILTIGYLIVKD